MRRDLGERARQQGARGGEQGERFGEIGDTRLTVMAALFYANAAGYVALTVALYHPHPALRRFRRVTRRALIGFTALTVVAYVALIQGHLDALGLTDKAIEVVLIALLVVEDRRAR